MNKLRMSLCFLAFTGSMLFANDQDPVQEYQRYRKVVQQTASMVSNQQAQNLVSKHGLNILNVTWEDTGRYKGSSVGPNISDVTIQVQEMDPRTEKFQLTCMPVIRYPNFSDKTADLSPNDFFVLVGNENNGSLKKITLTEYLDNFRKYLNKPSSWKGSETSLLAARDTHVLVSAQACFLPIPQSGKAEFNPVIFNYQSSQGNPAVLTILATREGTSATIIDNTRDGFEAGDTWGQRLFFNKNGERASLTGQRISDFKKQNPNPTNNNSVGANKEQGLNMVLLIQVPLKHKSFLRKESEVYEMYSEDDGAGMENESSDVEEAVIGHGKVEGPYTEIDNLKIERDPRFPVRVTVQFYMATSNGVINEANAGMIRKQIDKVYKNADYVGSLVTEGMTGRPTEYEGPKFQPPTWWEDFWRHHHNNTGKTREQTITMLKKLYGEQDWVRMAKDRDKFSEAVKMASNKK